MRVIPNGSGWDIALDMVFNDKRTAFTIAQRIGYALQALIRDAVDTSMVGHTGGQGSEARQPRQPH
jgi:hypothetical protein